ncbi:uncharacterized protein LOC124370929 [Homalodisca vitripennis]|uniref:uncharacterized protein LOC124370929 n=1 Tax=Homalodisca vitripennis TaxID=197043 RepID=UPI001EEA8A29|nr:uncharacterized protein LOC124370929 [Homalodisca vitripennis]
MGITPLEPSGSQIMWICFLLSTVCMFGRSDSFESLSPCTTDEECEEMRICVDHKCQDACPIICYGNATCQIYKNIYCPCLSAFSPWFHGCVEQETPGKPK